MIGKYYAQDGRKIDVRQGRDGQQPIGHETAQQEHHHQRGGGDRPVDERTGLRGWHALFVPRSVSARSFVVSCQLRARSVSAWTFSIMRLMLFFDGRSAERALPVVGEYIRPNVNPKKSNSPSETLQMRVFSSFTVIFSLPMMARR